MSLLCILIECENKCVYILYVESMFLA